MIHFRCEFCNRRLEAANSLAGRQILCRHCHEKQEVPEPDDGDGHRDWTLLEYSTGAWMALLIAAALFGIVSAVAGNGSDHVIGPLVTVGAVINLGFCFVVLLLIDIARKVGMKGGRQ
jgi:hypothetical protein